MVSFSDSRQDAARAALDIERNHHQDLRRELLVSNLHEALRSRRDPETIEEEIAEAKERVIESLDSPGSKRRRRSLELEALQTELRDGEETSVPLASVLEDWNDWNADAERMEVSPLLSDLVRRGVHPCDDAGIEQLEEPPTTTRRTAGMRGPTSSA